jgi:hypothetical protein
LIPPRFESAIILEHEGFPSLNCKPTLSEFL